MRTSNVPTDTDRINRPANGTKEGQMSGTTGTIRQPVATGSFLPALGMAAAVLAAAVAITWGSANLGQATVAKPASPLYAPVVRDLGARDPGSAAAGLAPVHDHGWSAAGQVKSLEDIKDQTFVGLPAAGLGYHGFGNQRPTSTGSSNGSSAGRGLAPRAQ
jgi:hypothetical protein